MRRAHQPFEGMQGRIQTIWYYNPVKDPCLGISLDIGDFSDSELDNWLIRKKVWKVAKRRSPTQRDRYTAKRPKPLTKGRALLLSGPSTEKWWGKKSESTTTTTTATIAATATTISTISSPPPRHYHHQTTTTTTTTTTITITTTSTTTGTLLRDLYIHAAPPL
ncbi:hypothetical protein HZH66_000237 [Vespula vulgaris]|uniref:Uncharacterized protein n=1 Tax=Vespula vulgaris TaxID=7454 RepID=A0A834KSW3_VESVU|nr:hypothetical protein HZH66_000237 [Vespula vulgaris]